MSDGVRVPPKRETDRLGRTEPHPIERFAPAFLGLLASRISETIVADGSRVASALEIRIPARCMSTMITLSQGPMGVSEIARVLGVSHVAAMNYVRQLTNLGLTSVGSDPRDARRKPIELTPNGEEAAQQLQIFVQHIQQVYLEIFDEIDIDVYDAMVRFEAALVRRSFYDRLSQVTQSH